MPLRKTFRKTSVHLTPAAVVSLARLLMVTLQPLSELAETFRAFGFVVLRQFFDPAPLAGEVDEALADGLLSGGAHVRGARFQYVPMMTSRTPESLSLLDRAATVAEAVLGGAVLPTRAKAIRYIGDTPWHIDSALAIESIGFLAYLEPLRADTGALRVLPGSHLQPFAGLVRARARAADLWIPDHVVLTEPGDMIVMDEHLLHASAGGGVRRQWRVDHLRVPDGEDARSRTKAYFAELFAPEESCYDVDRYPSYGSGWHRSGRPAVEQLGALGVYELAAAQAEQLRGQDPTPGCRD